MSFSRIPGRLPKFTPLTQRPRLLRYPFPNKLVQYFRRAELIDSIRLALRSGRSLGSVLDSRVLDSFVVAQALRSSHDANSALSLVESLKEVPHFSHDHATVHALAAVLARSCKSSGLKTLIDDIKAGSFGKVNVSSMSLMRWYASMNDLESLIRTWEDYRLSCSKWICAESFNLVMRTYVGVGKDWEAVEVLRMMIDSGTIPNCRTFTIMIEHLLSKGKLDAALEVFDKLPAMRIRRTSMQYLVLVEGFVGAKRFEDVRHLLDEMRVDGMLPGRAMRMALLQMGEEKLGEDLGMLLSEMNPDARIKGIENDVESDDDNEDWDADKIRAVEAEEEPEKIRLKPWLDPRALADALNTWSPEIVKELERANFVWTSRLVCKVIRGFKSPEAAWNFFIWVACQPDFTHDIYTVQRMITLSAQHGNVELVDKLLSKIKQDGLRLSCCTFRLIIDYYGISKNADAALRIFQDDRALCGTINKFNLMLLYSSLLRTLTKCKRESDVIDVLQEMISCQVVPDIQTFSGLMNYFALQGDIKTVEKLFTLLRQSGMEPDAFLYKVLIQANCKTDRAALAWRIFEEMRSWNLLPDVATKKLLTKTLWKAGKRKEVATIEEIYPETDDSLPRVLQGHLWTVSSADLTGVYNLYCNNIEKPA